MIHDWLSSPSPASGSGSGTGRTSGRSPGSSRSHPKHLAAFGAEPPDRVWAHIADGNGDRLVSISPHGWDDHENNRENADIYKERLAVPDDDWCVYSIHQENSDT